MYYDPERTSDRMRLMVSESVESCWGEWLQQFKGNIYHSAEWAYIRQRTHSLPLFFHWLDHNRNCLGIAVGMKSWSPVRYIGHFSRRLDFETYPASLGNGVDLIRAMIGQLSDFAKKFGYITLAVHSYGANIVVPDLGQLGFTTFPRMEYFLDLTMPEEELWRRLSSHHKRKIKNAGKQGLVFEEAYTLDAIRKFRNLQKLSRDRRVQRGEDLRTLDDASFEEMGNRCLEKNLGRVFFMTHGDEPVSAAFITIYGGQAIYVYGGSSDEGFGMDAPALLFWEIFVRCREYGCTEFSMGGVPASATDIDSQSHGLYRFKKGFGGKQVMCLSGVAENINPRRAWLIREAKKRFRY